MANSLNKKEAGKTVTKTAPGKPERIIYVGPSLPRGELQKYMLFKGGIPQHITQVFARYPLIRALFAQPAAMAEVERKINTKGTLENAACMQVIAGGIRPQLEEESVKGVELNGDV